MTLAGLRKNMLEEIVFISESENSNLQMIVFFLEVTKQSIKRIHTHTQKPNRNRFSNLSWRLLNINTWPNSFDSSEASEGRHNTAQLTI